MCPQRPPALCLHLLCRLPQSLCCQGHLLAKRKGCLLDSDSCCRGRAQWGIVCQEVLLALVFLPYLHFKRWTAAPPAALRRRVLQEALQPPHASAAQDSGGLCFDP